jgi:hypothetical protein
MIERCSEDVRRLDVPVNKAFCVDLGYSAEELKYEPFFLHHRQLRNSVQLLFKIVAHKLPNTHDSLAVDVEYPVIRHHIGVLVDIEGCFYAIELVIIVAELVVLYLREVELADKRPLILGRRQDCVEQEGLILQKLRHKILLRESLKLSYGIYLRRNVSTLRPCYT